MDTVRTEIDADRPILVEAKRGGRAGHCNLIIGYNHAPRSIPTVTIYDPAANLLPDYKEYVELRTMSFEVPYYQLALNFPTSKHKVSHYSTNLVAGGGVLTATPNWAIYHG